MTVRRGKIHCHSSDTQQKEYSSTCVPHCLVIHALGVVLLSLSFSAMCMHSLPTLCVHTYICVIHCDLMSVCVCGCLNMCACVCSLLAVCVYACDLVMVYVGALDYVGAYIVFVSLCSV